MNNDIIEINKKIEKANQRIKEYLVNKKKKQKLF